MDYQGSNKLKPENGGSESKLSHEQSINLETHLQTYVYLYVKDIVAHVEVAFKVNYSVAGMTHWLRRHGFAYKKPAIVPGKANAKDQEQWIAEYEKLKQGLLPDETICFADGVHPTHNTIATYGWIKKGERKEIASNSGRSRLNLSGSLDILSKKLVIHEDVTLNANSTITFIKKIESSYPRASKVHLFCDNAKYYRNKEVKSYLETSKVCMHFLPPYSPNLNPIERLWKWLKERVIYNTYYSEFEDFKQSILGFLEGVSNLDSLSPLGVEFARRVRDKFRPINSPLSHSSI